MFKAAFPWAQQEEEAAEKEYIKSLDKTSSEEVAGNVWIHPDEGAFHVPPHPTAHLHPHVPPLSTSPR